MKPVYVKVVLFDPTADSAGETEQYHVFEDLDVQAARVDPDNPDQAEEAINLSPDPDRMIFCLKSRRRPVDSSYYLRVHFHKRNFSKATRRLHTPDEIVPAMRPLYCPARLPFWDSGWDDGYKSNEFFGDDGPRTDLSPERPLLLKIPLRRIYIIGHRGAPYHFPENTLASFQKALELGANGLEFDLCLTRDKRVVIFHDAHPDSTRIQFEDFPFELVSPQFDGDVALIREYKDGEYRIARKRRMFSGRSFDIMKLTADQVRKWYRYHHVQGHEHSVPDLEEFLRFVAAETDHLKLLFFDVKNPHWDHKKDKKRFILYGETIGRTLQSFPSLPERLVIANDTTEVLGYLKDGIRQAGENRCEFAYDAAGSFAAAFGFKSNPLSVAREMENTVVSIGTRFRSGDLEEIIEATRDRDYNPASALSTVLHWTINDQPSMYHSFVAGVNGILTDRPEVMRDLLSKLGVSVR